MLRRRRMRKLTEGAQQNLAHRSPCNVLHTRRLNSTLHVNPRPFPKQKKTEDSSTIPKLSSQNCETNQCGMRLEISQRHLWRATTLKIT